MKKRFLAALLCLCLLVGLVPGMGTTAFAASDHNIGDIVTFAGYDWYIIGTESEGVTAPEGCYTLFAKNNDFSSTTFRAGANQEDSIGESLQGQRPAKKDGGNRKRILRRGQMPTLLPVTRWTALRANHPPAQLLWPVSEANGTA